MMGPDKLEKEFLSIFNMPIDWKILRNTTILITGATGLIGNYLIELLLYRNKVFNDNIFIVAMCRDKKRATERFINHRDSMYLSFLEQNVFDPIKDLKVDYVIHGASNADPVNISKDPVGTMLANFLGMKNILDFVIDNKVKRTMFLSTGEVYGEGSEGLESFKEEDSGYINCNSPRSCYPESKRAAETLCASYMSQFDADVVISRLCYVYGPTMTKTDSRVIAQFIRNAVMNESIVMKSSGSQIRSYSYIQDAVSGLLFVLLNGSKGNVYNISNKNCSISIKQIAETISKLYNINIVYEQAGDFEARGYSVIQKAILNSDKLESLGWNAAVSLEEGLTRTINLLRGAV